MTDMYVAFNCIFLFEVIPFIFQAIQRQHGEQCIESINYHF